MVKKEAAIIASNRFKTTDCKKDKSYLYMMLEEGATELHFLRKEKLKNQKSFKLGTRSVAQ